jgi:putative NIF3 family GTP cyclohydrolase 1 type 2
MIVKEVVDRIIDTCNVNPEAWQSRQMSTCDTLIVGDWNQEVTAIVTTFMATVDVINDAVAKGANLIITHEPTFYTSTDDRDWLTSDDVYSLKQQKINDNQVSIWRFHDHMHMTKPDLIYAGIEKELSWSGHHILDKPHCYEIPPITLRELSIYLKDRLDVKLAQIIGTETSIVERVGLLVGGGSLGLGSEIMPMELMQNEDLDVIVCGEIVEWTLCAYVRDACQLGLNKSLIILGHNRSEEAGMKYLREWLKTLFPDIPVWFSEAGEPFSYI